jgi:hypothetical protein
MTNVIGTVEKKFTRQILFAFGERFLEQMGYKVSRIPRGGKASLRSISKDGKTYKVSIRTSQDTWIAFPRNSSDTGWVTLDDVDYVIAVSVNDRHAPKEAWVHMIPGDVARDHFDRAYKARKNAGHSIPIGRGIWVSLYERDEEDPVNHVGAGMGLDYPTNTTLRLTRDIPLDEEIVCYEQAIVDYDEVLHDAVETSRELPLSIGEAKRRLAQTFGVPESSVKITIEH